MTNIKHYEMFSKQSLAHVWKIQYVKNNTELKLHFYQSKHKNGIWNIALVHH